jgi:hypothetical protein
MQIKNRLLFLFLFLAPLCAGQSNVQPEWAAFSTPLKWESPPRELHANTKSTAAGYCCGEVFRQELQRNEATEVGVLSLVDHTHPAAADSLKDAVVGDGLTNHAP